MSSPFLKVFFFKNGMLDVGVYALTAVDETGAKEEYSLFDEFAFRTPFVFLPAEKKVKKVKSEHHWLEGGGIEGNQDELIPLAVHSNWGFFSLDKEEAELAFVACCRDAEISHKEKQARRDQLLRQNGLDDESIRIRREEVLRQAGLL